jgi:hypothetical protein
VGARRSMRQSILIGAAAVTASLVAVPVALGGGGGGCSGGFSNGGPSSVAQYIEQVPTSCGSNASATQSSQAKLPKSVSKKLQRTGGKDAKRLEKIATETRYGAPSETAAAAPKKVVKVKNANAKVHHRTKTVLPRAVQHPNRTQVSALSGFGGVVADGSDSRLIALLAVMAVTAIAAAVLAIVRRRSPR